MTARKKKTAKDRKPEQPPVTVHDRDPLGAPPEPEPEPAGEPD